MGANTTSYGKGTTKSVKMNIPQTPIEEQNNKTNGFRKGMKEKLKKQIALKGSILEFT